jgi:phenylacetate-coenzyme A ligase PaaK-like adenylate-forming protein
MLTKDLWSIKGIIGSGIDSSVYKNKIQDMWGKQSLDLYACTEGGAIAVQVWDYDDMTFIPNLNFLEFVPEEEQLKLEMDRTYIPRTLLLNEVKAGETYEIVITSFHVGAMIRYRVGDMVRINALRNEKLGIDTPQMAFERRADELMDFVFVRLTEKTIWEAIENTGIPYTDWIAIRKEGESFLHICLEPADACHASEKEIAESIYRQITALDDNDNKSLLIRNDFADFVDFKVGVTLLPRGTFDNYAAQRRAEGADLAHLKPPHMNPTGKILSMLASNAEETIVVTKLGTRVQKKSGIQKASIP